jgi:hypothetical protein
MFSKQKYLVSIRQNILFLEPSVKRAFPLPSRERVRVRGRYKVCSPSPDSSSVKGEDVTGNHQKNGGLRLVFVLLLFLIMGLATKPSAVFSQTLPQLIEGAKKEGSLVLSWGTGTIGSKASRR